MSAFAEILFGFVDRSTASTIATLAYEYSRWNGSLGGILLGSRRRLVVIVRCRSWTSIAAATHVDSRLFRGFSSQHFRLGLFVRFKGNLVQPKAIRSEGGFEFHPPPRLRSARFASNPIRNPFLPGESRAPFKGDPTFIDCWEKLIRAFPSLKASDTLPRSSTVLGKLECYFCHKSSSIFGTRKIDISMI